MYDYHKQNINNIEKYDSSKTNIDDIISMDLGMGNLMTIYNPSGDQRIVKGGDLINTNEFYNKLIAKSKSENNLELTRRLFKKRENVLNYKLNRIVSVLFNKYQNKKEIIVGYNEGWKQHVNLGRNTNRKFYEIPYARILNKMRDKFENTRIIEVFEGYTSKCDSLMLESIGFHEEYSGNRIKRGLFSSGSKKLINADLNGAINIMRRYCKNSGIEFGKKVKGSEIYNPTVLKLTPRSH